MGAEAELPTIPEYFKQYINNSVDLEGFPKCCCPFHHEESPSFSYQAEKGVWRCFGSCKVGGDVVDLHRVNYKLATRDSALRSLCALYNISLEKRVTELEVKVPVVNKRKMQVEAIYQEALMRATAVDKWLELDYVMSKTPLEVDELKELVMRWRDESSRDSMCKKR